METKVAAAAVLSLTLPALAEGEHLAGLIVDGGKPSHWVVLLPGDTSTTWKKAVEWAAKQGGELPTRREQSLLFANCGAEFKRDWYWSGEQRAGAADYAWGQGFGNGGQDCDYVSGRYRARAVRRVAIQ